MNITKLLFLSAALMVTTTIGAQKKRNTRAVPIFNTEAFNRAVNEYRFAEAEQMLVKYVDGLRFINQDPSVYEIKLRQVQQAKKRALATEKIVIIDSLVVHRSCVLAHIPLSSESGQITSDQQNTNDSITTYAFHSQLGDHKIYSQLESDSTLRLYEQKLVDTEWTTPIALNELGLDVHEDQSQNYPYVLNDGVTLYYAACGNESMGGYDIFMSRFDTDELRFLAPENIGMPFNSPANDYLYVIDDYYQLGWFVTDRNQPADSVCIYTFIPNNSRSIYDVNEIGEQKIRAMAQINCIADTWKDVILVEKAKARLIELKNELCENVSVHTDNYRLVINDHLIVTSISQLRTTEAQQLASWWLKGQNDLKTCRQQIDSLRQSYVSATVEQRRLLESQILELESRLRSLNKSLETQLQQIRKLENKN